VKSNVGKYRKSAAITEYQEHEGRSHLTVAQDGWEAVADGALEWALSRATTVSPSWS
jgi:hypothetical protein